MIINNFEDIVFIVLGCAVGAFLGYLSGAAHWFIILFCLFGYIGIQIQEKYDDYVYELGDKKNAKMEEISEKITICLVIIAVLYAASHITW